MRNTITNLSREALTDAGVVRPTVTLNSLRLDARASGQAQVISHADNASRVLVVTPSGSVMGTSLTPMGWFEAEELAESLSAKFGWGGHTCRMDEVAR